MFVRHHYKKGHVELVYINTKENIADIMTKCLKSKTQHKYLLSKLLCELRNGTLVSVHGKRVTASPRPKLVDEVDLSLAQKPWGQTFKNSGWELHETQASSKSAIYDHDRDCQDPEDTPKANLYRRLSVGAQAQLQRLEASQVCKSVRALMAGPQSLTRSHLVSTLRALLRV
jgi:hypothetical protein